MRIKANYFLILFITSSFCYCDKNPVAPKSENSLQRLNGPTVIYGLVSDNLLENRIYTANSDRRLFSDNTIYSNIRMSPDKKNTAYVKNSTLHPWFGYYSNGIPTVTISNNINNNEKELMRSDSSDVLLIEWISEKNIAISSKEDSLFYLSIINSDGDTIKRMKVTQLYKLYMLPDGQHLVAYNNKEFGVLNTLSYDFQQFSPGGDLSTWQLPFYTGASFILNTFDNGYHYIEFYLVNNSYRKIAIKTPDTRLVFANANYCVYYNFSDRKKFTLFKDGVQISSLFIDAYVCEAGLALTEQKDFYFAGESTQIADEGVIVKVNFDTNQISKLTNHGENHFIIDCIFYNL